MWFFIVTLMIMGAFLCGMIVTAVRHKEELLLHEDYLKELKFITDALRNPSCPPPAPFNMPDPSYYFKTPTKITSGSDGENQ